jgi:hypothetical protein
LPAAVFPYSGPYIVLVYAMKVYKAEVYQFSKKPKELPQNSRYQNADMKQVPY